MLLQVRLVVYSACYQLSYNCQRNGHSYTFFHLDFRGRIIYHSSDWHRPHPAGSGWPQIHSKSPASASQVLRSHVWTILLRNSLRSLESYLPSVKDINGWDSVQFVECFLACTKPWICSPGVCELGVVVHFCNPNNGNAGCRGKRIRNLKSFSTTCWVWE